MMLYQVQPVHRVRQVSQFIKGGLAEEMDAMDNISKTINII